jgi:hypothetical protein
MYSVHDTCLMTGGFPHSEILGSQSGCRLPEAYRRLQRPSSPPTAKASTMCAYSLDHISKQSTCTTHRSRDIWRHCSRLNSQRLFPPDSVSRLSVTVALDFQLIDLVKEHLVVKTRRQCSAREHSLLILKRQAIHFRCLRKVVEPRRIELLTSCVQGRRSPS